MNVIRIIGGWLIAFLATSASATVNPNYCPTQSAVEAGNNQTVTLSMSFVPVQLGLGICGLSNSPIPTGTVTFSGLGSTTVNIVNGIATYNFVSNVSAPTNLTIVATYSGDSNYRSFAYPNFTISQYVKIPSRFINCVTNTAPAGTTEVCIDGTSPVSGSASLYLTLGSSTSYRLLGTAQVTDGIAYIPTPSDTFTPGAQSKNIYATYSGDTNNVPVTYTLINQVGAIGGNKSPVPNAPWWALAILGIMLTTIVFRSRERPAQ